MKKTIKIEQGDISNLQEIVSLNHQIFDKMYEKDPYTLEEYKDRLKNKSPFILVAKLNGKIIGNAISYKQDGSWYNWIMGVAEEYRGQGIGTQLLEQREQYAIKKGYKSITAKVYGVSQAMQQLYKSRGYKVINVLKSKNDPKYDALIFELKLN